MTSTDDLIDTTTDFKSSEHCLKQRVDETSTVDGNADGDVQNDCKTHSSDCS